MTEILIILVTAYLLDSAIGDPVYRFHPVRMTGRLISFVERSLFRLKMTGISGGILLLVLVNTVILSVYFALFTVLSGMHIWSGAALNIFVLYSSICLKDMWDHALPIIKALERDNIQEARNLTQMIVGRDSEQLDKSGLARAVIESCAENFVDGFLSPLFWFVIGAFTGFLTGLDAQLCAVCFALIYRTVNTLDSMVGYRNKKYLYFGRASARLDDVLNFVPARLSIIIIAVSSYIKRLDTLSCWKTAMKDRLSHESPNSAHAESSVAGALNIRLGGPVNYKHYVSERKWIGSGPALATPEHILTTCSLLNIAGSITVLVCITLFFAMAMI